MPSKLETFLAAEDLDQALEAQRQIAVLDAQETATIRSILQEWRNRQAVSNLLMHAMLIPEDMRLSSLRRGLAERNILYYVLAAVVGLQGIEPGEVTTADRERVLAELLALIRDTTGILAERASVSFHRFAVEDDAPRVFALMGQTDDTVRHNLRAWLFRTFQSRGVEPFVAAARRSGLSDDLQQYVVAEFNGFVTDPPQGLDSPLFVLFGYIPNLRDVEQSA